MEHHEEFDEVVYDPHLKCLVLPSELSSTPPSSLAPLPLSSSPLSSSSLSSSSSTSPSPPPFEISGEQEEKFKIAVKNTTPPISMFSCYGEKLVYKLDCIRGTTEGKNLSQSSSCLPLCLVNLYRHSLFLQRALFFASPLVWLAAVVVSIISGEEGSFPVFFLSLLMFAALLMFESIGLVFIDLELGLAWSFFLVRYVPQFSFTQKPVAEIEVYTPQELKRIFPPFFFKDHPCQFQSDRIRVLAIDRTWQFGFLFGCSIIPTFSFFITALIGSMISFENWDIESNGLYNDLSDEFFYQWLNGRNTGFQIFFFFAVYLGLYIIKCLFYSLGYLLSLCDCLFSLERGVMGCWMRCYLQAIQDEESKPLLVND